MKLLMLGNGFDLYHKLPTTYLCFLQVSHSLSGKSHIPNSIANVFAELKDKCEKINITYTAYANFHEDYSFDDMDKHDMLELKRIISNNMWFKFFWNSYNVNADWTDFEKEISDVLLAFSEALADPNLYNQITDEIWHNTENSLIRHFDVFSSRQDYSSVYLNHNYVTNSPTSVNLYSVNRHKIYKDLYNGLIELAEALKLYLSVFVEKPLSKMKEKNIIEENSLFVGYSNVITFNYTNTYETLYGKTSMHHIHGKLNKNIILGVNPDIKDELQDLDTSYIMFKKYYQRIYHRTDNSFIELINELENDKHKLSPQQNSLVVCGHSLNVTDEDIIKQIFGVSDRIYIICNEVSKIGDYVTNLIQIYGKSEFDRIRSEKQLEFLTYEEWKCK